MHYSFIIPVYNRPDEIDELLESLSKQIFHNPFEVVVVEDGSTIKCNDIVEKYKNQLVISYYYKQNSGPGASRNYGMERAKGNYFIILDSDCIIPPQYLSTVDEYLQKEYVDCFGGPDAALKQFSDIQKAINYAMTSFWTTGGIRGSSENLQKFQPRSFNMGLSKNAFIATKGFGKIHPGEDPDLVIRLWELGYDTKLFPKAFVYHKRRIDWNKFYVQVNKFGKARPILNQRYPNYSKWSFWLPSLFCLGFILSIIGLLFSSITLFSIYILYFFIFFIHVLIREKNIKIALFSIYAAIIQFYGYGKGFILSTWKLRIKNQKAEEAMPELFF